MSDYNPFAIPPELLQQLANPKSGKAAGLNAFNQGFTPGLNSFASQIPQMIQAQKQKQALQQVLAGLQKQGKTPFNGIDPNQMASALGPDMTSKLIAQQMGLGAKQTSPWRVVPGMMSKAGRPIQQNELTGEVREAGLDAVPTGRGNAGFGTSDVSWDSATPAQKRLAIGLYNGDIRPFDLGYKDRSVGTMLANEYANKNGLPPFQSYSGNVKGKMAEALSSGKLGMNALSLNTALGHANAAKSAYERVKNTNVRFLNVPINKIREQTNDPNIIKLQMTLNALSGELATTFKGSAGTDQEIGHWMKVLSQDLTPAQAMGAIQQVNELLRSRLDALKYQQQDVMDKRPGDRTLLSPHAAELQKNIDKSGQKNSDISSMSDDELRRIAAGGK